MIQNQSYSTEFRFLKSYCNSLYIFIISILYICLHPLIVTCNCTSECKALPACVNEVMCWSLKGMFGLSLSLQVVQDWKFVAQVLDRVFLWTFLLVSVLGSALLFIPVIYKWANIIVPNHAGDSG